MPEQTPASYRLPTQLPQYIKIVAADCDRKGEALLRDLLNGATHAVEEASEPDLPDRATVGHAVHLSVPPEICRRIGLGDLSGLEGIIGDRLNKVARVAGEYISRVTIKRREPPVIGQPMSASSRDGEADLWGDIDFLRLFISHKADDKVLASHIKEECSALGISCFVAHEDVEPTAQWQVEIERALRSMDALLALLTPRFHASYWTDQEVGVAIGRGIPVIPLKVDQDPYGLIGKYQAISGAGRAAADLAQEMLTTLLERVDTTRERMETALVARFEQANNFDHAKTLMGHLRQLDVLPLHLVDRLEAAQWRNGQVAGAYAVQNHLPGLLRRLREAAGTS